MRVLSSWLPRCVSVRLSVALLHTHCPDSMCQALRGEGGLLLDRNGQRFCNELGHRDYVSGEMFKNKGPFRLVLNSSGGTPARWGRVQL